MDRKPHTISMDDFKAPPLSKNSTYHIVAQDEFDADAKTPPEKQYAPSERPSLTTSMSSASSITLTDKRYSTHSTKQLANTHRKKKKPLAGDRFFKALRQVPIIYKIGFAIFVTGIPFAIFTAVGFTIKFDQFIGPDELNVQYQKMALFLDIGWILAFVILGLAEYSARFFSRLCRLCTSTIKYAPLAHTLMFRVTLMFWIGAMRLATCRLWPTAMDDELLKNRNWVYAMRRALEFLAIAACILVIQGLVVQSIAIQYVQGYIGPRSENAMNELETLQQLDKLLKPRNRDNKSKACGDFINKLFMPRKECCFDAIRKGRCCNEETRGYAAILWTTVAGNMPVITLLDIYEHLVLLKRETDGAAEFFALLDRNGHGVVSRQEFEDLVLQVASQLKKRAAAMHGIKLLLNKLEIVFTLVVLGAIIFVYSKSPLPSATAQTY